MDVKFWLKQLKNPAVFLNLVKYRFSKPAPVLHYSPLSLTLWITDRCNLNCSFCLKNKPELEYRHQILPDMTMDTVKKILPMFKTATTIAFIGQGEPLLNKDLFDMIEYASNMNRRTSLITNGALIDRQMAERLMSSKLNTISVSLKACSPEDFHAVTRCPASEYAKVIDGIKYLVELRKKTGKKKDIVLSHVLYKSRLSDINEVIPMAESLGVDCLLLLNFIPFGSFDGKGSAKEVLFSDDKEAAGVIDRLKAVPRNMRVIWPVLLRRGNYHGCCHSNFNNLCIDSAGNIGFCDRVLPPSSEYGNVFKDKNIWNSKYLVEMRTCLLSEGDNLPQRCKFCVDMSG